MKLSEAMDKTDHIDQISNNLDIAEGILSALEITLSTIDTCHPKLPFALTAAMQCIDASRGLIKEIVQDEEALKMAC